MNFLKNYFNIFALILSVNVFANNNIIEEEKLNKIDSFLQTYGYTHTSIDFNSEYINNTYKLTLQEVNKELTSIRPKSDLFIVNHDLSQGFIVFDSEDNIQKNTYTRMKNSIRSFKKSKENRKFLKFTLPIQNKIDNNFNNVDMYNSTTHSFLMPHYNRKVIFGELIDFTNNDFNNITKDKILDKKEKETITLNKIIKTHPDLIFKSQDYNKDKMIVILFSETCGYCKRMILDYKKYNEKGYSLLVLPAPEVSYDLKFNQLTYKYFCSNNVISLLKTRYDENCSADNERLKDVYRLKRELLQGIEYKGTPTLYLTEYKLWHSGYLDHKRLK